MFKFILILFATLTLSACVTTPQTPAYRVGKVFIDTNNQQHGAYVKQLLQQKIEYLVRDRSRLLPSSAPTRDLYVRTSFIRFAKPRGIIVPGRSAIKITYQFDPAAPGTRYFTVSDVKDPPLREAFNLSSYFAFERSFDRLTDRVANRLIARIYRNSDLRLQPNLSRVPVNPTASNKLSTQRGSALVKGPPAVLIAN